MLGAVDVGAVNPICAACNGRHVAHICAKARGPRSSKNAASRRVNSNGQLSTATAAFGAALAHALSDIDRLAVLLQEQGHLAVARPLFEAALTARRGALGSAHPSTLASQNNLCVLLYHEGRIDEALESLEQALGGYRAVLGSTHPHTLALINNLAGMLLTTPKRKGEARALYEESLAGYRADAEHGEGHPLTLNVQGNLGMLLAEHGRSAEERAAALPTIEAAAAGIRAARGDDHPHARKFTAALVELRQ